MSFEKINIGTDIWSNIWIIPHCAPFKRNHQHAEINLHTQEWEVYFANVCSWYQ